MKKLMIFLLLFVTVVFCFLHSTGNIATWSGKFDPDTWEKFPKMRHRMIEDMENRIDIYNLTRDEIVEVLGSNSADIGESGVRYLIQIGSFGFPEWYVILFTDDGKVDYIWRHFD